MKIVQISSGLGNQMFQYALYRKLLTMEDDVYIDAITSYELFKNQHNGYELEKIFNINPKHANIRYIKQLSDTNSRLFARIRRKSFGVKRTMYIESKEFKYDEDLFRNKDLYIKGYWQNLNYFKGIANELKEDFIFYKELDPKNQRLAQDIFSGNSVSIHIRRGDYYKNKSYEKKFGNVATLSYYQQAIDLIKSKIENPQFYVFSDDMDWVKENLDLGEGTTYVDYNKKEDSYKDMQLMSICKHNIIANSTFSWWGAFLNVNPNKIVIAPKKWINIDWLDEVEIFPDDWILLETI